ncbi:uncharacterized membrane protein YgdD (TMEM256/DUF423 family) [Mariniflexile fucanivorans]|uniref:Uncharacterized membrane protein YgdD (TMEM256/DUF423 family) n=1 Tax=Mariniflexile fucanivorans TaxID=264023 RepID=A0A4V2QEN8_9FLAO|nr:DUF423 domain-containing protein [Mariniflexile fucanivorans]TCL68797.1 uncharacterized membrane protein YgdD (TMEM256/DUF423 family) [Mariniflexile fucanivorans]
MNKTILITASILGITAIILGAFGAHGLKPLISIEAQQTFETGVRYQMYHAIFLLFVGSTVHIRLKFKKQIYYFTLIGVLLFSGSIYGLATNALTTFNFKIIGFITPIGGLFLILSWFSLLVNFLKIKD